MLTDEERAVRAAEKAAKRAANKEAWKYHPANANAAWIERQVELKAASADIVVELADAENTGSLAKLRAIMAGTAAPLYRRLDAAEVVLAYELAPASMVQAPGDQQIAATSFRFLQAVADAAETPEALRFRALKSIAAIENARATRVDGEHLTERRELLVALVNAQRRRALCDAGRWPPPQGEEWSLSYGDQFDWPEGWGGGGGPWPTNIGERLDRTKREAKADPVGFAAKRAARAARLLAVRAKNRRDDWERLLGDQGT